jgi:Domain of unknown function (DUF397)
MSTADMPVIWRKSIRRQPNGSYVELAVLDGRIGVRDSKDPDGPILTFPWAALIADVKAGRVA